MNKVDETKMMLELARAYFNHIVKADNLSFAKNMAAIGVDEIGDYLRKKVEPDTEHTNETI